MYWFTQLKLAIKRFRSAQEAALSIQFALMLLPIIGTCGFSYDLSNLLAVRTRAQTISDAAVINALAIVKNYMDTNGNTTTAFNSIKPSAITTTQTFINGSLSALSDATNFTATTNVTFSSSTNSLTATSSISYNYQTNFLNMVGVANVAAGSTSSATATLLKFVQVIFLVDVSGSMAVGATSSDVSALEANFSCAFACHTNPAVSGSPEIETPAHALGIKLKIDYARAAVTDFTSQLSTLSTQNPGHYYTGIYTFSGTMHSVLSPTSNYTQVTNSLPSIDLDLANGVTPCASYSCAGWTDLQDTLSAINTAFTNVGDGSSPSSMQTYLILVTDGVEDIYLNGWGYCCGHYTDATWNGSCASIKSKGVSIATVQAIYTPFTDNSIYNSLVAPLVGSVPTTMKNCASSSSMALSASDGPGLQTAINSLFATVVSTPRLTN